MPWNTDWSKPLYEIAFAPGKGNFPDDFAPVDDNVLPEWDKDPRLFKVEFPDGSNLYLSTQWTEEDQNILGREFWGQRWSRYFAKIRPWLTWALGPPLALLILGLAFAWVLRGFRKQPQSA
jgi:hypothetical protein